jgi:hypothetical protein
VPKPDQYEKWKWGSNSGHDTVIGQKDGLSHGDIRGINLMYTGSNSESARRALLATSSSSSSSSSSSGSSLNEKLACDFGGLTGTCNWENGFYHQKYDNVSDFPFVPASGTDYDPYAPRSASPTSSDAGYLQLNSKHLSTIKMTGMSAALYSPVVSLAGSTAGRTSQCLNFDVHLAKSSKLVLEVQAVSTPRLRNGKITKWGRIWDRSSSTRTVVNGAWTKIQVPLSSIFAQSARAQLRFVGEIGENPIKSAVGIDNMHVGPCATTPAMYIAIE